MCHLAPRKIKAIDVKHAIKHAQNLCFNFEDSPECRAAWEIVDELTQEVERSKRKYDL
jgi:hypothetical protein